MPTRQRRWACPGCGLCLESTALGARARPGSRWRASSASAAKAPSKRRGRVRVPSSPGELRGRNVHNPYEGNSRVPPPFPRPRAGKYIYDNGRVQGLEPDDLEFTKALYDERIHYMDGHIAELLELAKRHGRDSDLTGRWGSRIADLSSRTGKARTYS